MKFTTRLNLALRLIAGDVPVETGFEHVLVEMRDIEARIAVARKELDEAVSKAWVTAQRDNILRVPNHDYAPGGGDDAPDVPDAPDAPDAPANLD